MSEETKENAMDGVNSSVLLELAEKWNHQAKDFIIAAQTMDEQGRVAAEMAFEAYHVCASELLYLINSNVPGEPERSDRL